MPRQSTTVRTPLSEGSPLLLASGSPRRREILASLGIPIVVSAVDIDESTRAGESPDAYLVRIVRSKLDAVAVYGAAGAVLVADTSVIDGDAILGKPSNSDDAERMIARLSGRTHEVWTRFAIGAPELPAPCLYAETVKTRVTFRALTPVQIRRYAETGEGLDKAGAYAVQGRGAAIVERIDGSYSNVVGLPACEVSVALEGLGLWS